MKYLIDTNSLHAQNVRAVSELGPVFVLEEVTQERIAYNESLEWTQGDDIQIETVYIEAKHLNSLQEVMSIDGDNFSVIDLYSGKGAADVLIVAYIIAERELPERLFDENYAEDITGEFTIVTKDEALIELAERNGIKCLREV